MTHEPVPCPYCDYDIGSCTADRCPECGGAITPGAAPADRRAGSRLGAETTAEATEVLLALFRGMLWSLPLWLGCVGIPGPGTILWVVLAFGSAARLMLLYQRRQAGGTEWLGDAAAEARWWLLARAECAVACAGTFLLIVMSFAPAPAVVGWLLSLLQCAWAALSALANASCLRAGLGLIRSEAVQRPAAYLVAAPQAALAGGVLVQPLLLMQLAPSLAKAVPSLAFITVMLFVAGCIAGIASIVAAWQVFEEAGGALRTGDRARAEAELSAREAQRRRVANDVSKAWSGPVRPSQRGAVDDDGPIPLADEEP